MSLLDLVTRDEAEREWMFDMHRRNARVVGLATAAVGTLALACVPWMKPITLVPITLCVVIAGLFSLMTDRTEDIRPALAGWFAVQALITVSIVVNGRALEPDICLLVFPMLAAAAGFPPRLIAVGTAYTALLMVAAALTDLDHLRAQPPDLLVPIGLLLGSVIVTAGLRQASAENRAAAAIDQLTGLPNRAALASRTDSLEEDGVIMTDAVAVLVADLDHFKAVNDGHGHAVGDDVLREAAFRMRSAIRAFDLGYRLGGEEFVFLLPGADTTQAAEIAERIRCAVSATPICGIPVTVSVGIAVSPAGDAFVFADTFASADAAMYEAKRAGRDRVLAA